MNVKREPSGSLFAWVRAAAVLSCWWKPNRKEVIPIEADGHCGRVRRATDRGKGSGERNRGPELLAAEGRAEGRAEGERALLLKQLQLKVGDLPETVRAQLDEATEESS